jgi:WD40 repeat protein
VYAIIQTFFHPDIVISLGTNKDIEVWDFSVTKLIHTFAEAHSRPAHSVHLHEPSPHTQQHMSPESYDLFLTAATDNAVKLWDLRTQR